MHYELHVLIKDGTCKIYVHGDVQFKEEISLICFKWAEIHQKPSVSDLLLLYVCLCVMNIDANCVERLKKCFI